MTTAHVIANRNVIGNYKPCGHNTDHIRRIYVVDRYYDNILYMYTVRTVHSNSYYMSVL